MQSLLIIASDEWRYWSRSKLGAAAAILAFILICVSVFATTNQVAAEKETREALQLKAEEIFRSQPDRHPHRMVHYGHYVFRTPAPLAKLDPGVDPYTGTAIFLEGHRQNSATFSASYDGAQAGPFARLTPALAYQLLVPLILIIVGFGAVSREREAETDRQLVTSGVTPVEIWGGKTIALAALAALLLIPMLFGVALSGGAPAVSAAFLGSYIIYLLIWILMISGASAWCKRPSTALLVLLSAWIALSVLAPRMVASAANIAIPSASQIEADMDVLVALREVGDGHNANDPAFARLRANLLEQYDVETVEELPINFRGMVAKTSEEQLTAILNEYAEKRMTQQVAQTDFVRALSFFSPFIALQSASMTAAGTDIRTHHRFLREAEAARYEFVQGLNDAHVEKLSYADDLNRNTSKEAWRKARVSSENWRVLQDFRFSPDTASERISRMGLTVGVLFGWALVMGGIGFIGARRLSEVKNG
ncbi:MAG: DUF3526 domain-containing protein [Aquisalinus sp.]|nr:DUF3526 domain-containing protein [Aquisalinus sp.]